MKIASVSSDRPGQTDSVLSDLAAHLTGQGRILAGIVRDQSHESRFANGCDMKVRVLPGGPVIQITQELGTGSDACRIDPGAIADAVAAVESGKIGGADLFILNKFGPEEAEGRGFCQAIAAALDKGVPVLVGVGAANRAAFDSFAGGLAAALPADMQALLDWCQPASAESPDLAES